MYLESRKTFYDDDFFKIFNKDSSRQKMVDFKFPLHLLRKVTLGVSEIPLRQSKEYKFFGVNNYVILNPRSVVG